MTHDDPLAAYRDRFVGTDTDLVYFDGNSLGRPLAVTAERLRDFVLDEWGGRLIRGWDERWFDLPLTLGDELGRICLGAAPGQIAVGDSTTVLLYKLMRAAVAARPGRTEIVIDRDNFPTDRYVADGVARECGLTLRWVDVDTSAGITARAAGRGRRRADGARRAQPRGVPIGLDRRRRRAAPRSSTTPARWCCGTCATRAGAVPVSLDAWGADLAVGCTYKYLNGGPGSPAFAYVADRHLATFTQPIQGWMGATDPFLMGPDYRPVAGIRRFLSGTPADRRDAGRAGHAGAARRGRDRGGPARSRSG